MKPWLSLPTILCSLWFGSPCGGEETSFAVVLFGEEQATLEPCGCAPGMLGGISRRDTALRQLRARGVPVVALHNGELGRLFGEQAQLKRDVQLVALRLAGVAAFGVGPGDLILGAGSLLDFQKRASFPLVATNLKDGRGQLTFAPHFETRLELSPQPVEVKVFSWVSATRQADVERVMPEMALSPLDELKALAKTKKEGEFWVLLFHGLAHEPQQLAREMPEWNLIVWNYEGEVPYQQQVGPTTIVSTGSKNHYFMACSFEAAPPYRIVRSERITLNDRYADSPEIEELIARYKSQAQEERLAEKQPRVRWPGGAAYAGSQSCAVCHQAEFEAWKNSKHARAQESLIAKKDAWDPDCLQCHSTGFRFEGGFVSREKTVEFASVGCESCHGPRSLHVKSPLEHKGKPVSRAACLECHDAENSPNFDADTYWPKIQH